MKNQILILTSSLLLFAGNGWTDVPAGRWTFDDRPNGVPGPRPPEWPEFSQNNRAVEISRPSEAIKLPHTDRLQFNQGDAITVEAWVDLYSLPAGQNMYIIGKGRTRNKGFAPDNQNYALRLRGVDGEARISFLFRSKDGAGHAGDYHRWNSKPGFLPDSGWHHIAVSYTFGQPESIQGYLDGKPVTGTWDIGGATDRPPVSDKDEIWIGSSMGGSSASTFNGRLDEIAIHRSMLAPEVIQSRFRHVPQPRKVEPKIEVPEGVVLMEISEQGVPPNRKWARERLPVEITWHEDLFGFVRTPLKYIETGIRTDRKNPFLLRASADITLPKGKHTLLIRSRNAARLKLDGKLIADLPFRGGFLDGHNGVKKDYLELASDLVYAFPGSKEKSVEVQTSGGPHRFVYEMIVGGLRGKDHFRPELGESSVSIRREGETHFTLLSPTRSIRFNDAAWNDLIKEKHHLYDRMDAEARKAAFAQHRDVWEQRHKTAAAGFTGHEDRSIDGFI
ncbi:MAG: LamG-like jellyroll fold domain-containing protein, partial [Verrucomicrobiota bacterium]